ncbi:MAG TPA: DUF4129 domain-containing protein [Fimbriimonas sp.]|nr:DUF4129 domain-containing protein [Fimbriimonas sp.]
MRIVRAASTFSLLVLAVCALAGDYSEMNARIEKLTSSEDIVRIVTEDPKIAADPDVDAILTDEYLDEDQVAAALKDTMAVRAMLEEPASLPPPKVDVKQIKSASVYRDTGVDETSNWLARALERLKNLKWEREPSSVNAGFLSGIGALLYYGAWLLIAVALSALIYFAVKHFRWKARLERRAATLLEESEPERTLDEWLEMANALEAEGRYREAVRALYLACLLRFDEALVARFDRSETNWEHLARIELSSKRPEGLDFRTPTRLFDHVWYGHKLRGREDVEQFRAWYIGITEMLRPQKVPA